MGDDGNGAGVAVGALVEVVVGDAGASMAGTRVGLAIGESSPHADRKAAKRHRTPMTTIRRPAAPDPTLKVATPLTSTPQKCALHGMAATIRA